jgi:uncharacterized membrane protein YhhN
MERNAISRPRTAALLAVSLASAAVFLAGGPGFSWITFATKLVPVTALLLWLAPPKGRYAFLVYAGLTLSLAGDAFLALPGDWFLPGLLSFLTAHLCYIAGFIGERRKPQTLYLIPYAAWVGATYGFLFPDLGEKAVPVGIYCLVITIMMWRAAALMTRPSERWQLAALIGATLFGLSDTALAVMRFHGAFPHGGAFLILAYWAGQTLIALSAKKGAARIAPTAPVAF